MARTKKNKNPVQWYITTCSNGNEDTVIKNLKAKILAMHFEEMIYDAKVIKIRTIEEEIFDDNNPNKLPPKNMRNTATIKWKTLGPGQYLKVKIIDRNKFPGYIYVKMIMNDDAWYAVRNAQNITGLVGSSGKGAKPIPITFEEEMLLSGESDNPDVRVVVLPNAIIEMDRTKFDEHGNLIGFETSPKSETNSSKEAVDTENNQHLPKVEKTQKATNKKEPVIEEPVEEVITDQIEPISHEIAKTELANDKVGAEAEKETITEPEIVEPINQEETTQNTEETEEVRETSAAEKQENLTINETKENNSFNLSKALDHINDVSKLLPDADFDLKNQTLPVDEQNYVTANHPYKIGHFVEVILGEHAGLQGNIVSIDHEKNQVCVQIEIMGKETVLLLDYNQITLKK